MVSFTIRSILPLEWHSMTLIENPSVLPLPMLEFSFLGRCFVQASPDPGSLWVTLAHLQGKCPCHFLSQQKNGCF